MKYKYMHIILNNSKKLLFNNLINKELKLYALLLINSRLIILKKIKLFKKQKSNQTLSHIYLLKILIVMNFINSSFYVSGAFKKFQLIYKNIIS